MGDTAGALAGGSIKVVGATVNVRKEGPSGWRLTQLVTCEAQSLQEYGETRTSRAGVWAFSESFSKAWTQKGPVLRG